MQKLNINVIVKISLEQNKQRENGLFSILDSISLQELNALLSEYFSIPDYIAPNWIVQKEFLNSTKKKCVSYEMMLENRNHTNHFSVT